MVEITAARPDRRLMDFPWEVPLEEWPESLLAALPRGISRHVVRFVRLGGSVLAVKEISDHLARGEYDLLRVLGRQDMPSVEPYAVVSGRRDRNGDPLDSVLVTRHLRFSLPYRAVFSSLTTAETADMLIDALAVLMVRLHLAGFYWGDVSLSNTLFRRDAGAFAAYLVDAETGAFHERLSRGQRNYDLDLARTNIIGEMMDLQAGERMDEDADVLSIGDRLVDRYHELWSTLTQLETFDTEERWRVSERIETLNRLGFDVEELELTTDMDGTRLSLQPKLVEAGHHRRRLLQLTGIDAGENQARRLLNDLDQFRAETDRAGEDESFVAHRWVADRYEPVIRSVPRHLRGKLQSPELYHMVLEHKWLLSEQRGTDVSLADTVGDFVANVLETLPDEEALVSTETRAVPLFPEGVMPAASNPFDDSSSPFDDLR
jgi:hypothetical protein